ncbi:MAG: hypothetical protein COX62_03265 [Deltaproteobacteria bacterium CG_4_10_14_0_2_um_filter_43_8]|nr:MAG: hypothetical protein COX62_03265 [Deltaproteobacteria bacterium CG_4_10_14_0_2_um_filter_43_8]
MIETFLATHQFNLLQILIAGIGYLMPIPLAMAALYLWHEYRQEVFIQGIKWVLLEIQIPRDVVKTPAAMELIFSNALYHKSGKGFWERYIMGAPWFWFSLEIASIDERVRFFVRTPTRVRDLVETQIYAQYPQAKIVETEDYAFKIPQYKKDGDWNMWGCEFTKLQHDVKPIKTYRQIEEMKSGTKEEFKIDPITPVIEYLGSLPKGQQVWIQIIVRQSIKTYSSHKTGKKVNFDDYAIEYMEDLFSEYTRIHPGAGEGGKDSKEVRPPGFLDPFVKPMVSNATQIHFDTGIRLVTLSNNKYCTKMQFENLRKSSRLLFRQYAAPNSNEFDRINSTQFDAPWSDPTGLALTKIKKRMLDFYRTRTFFHPPQNQYRA